MTDSNRLEITELSSTQVDRSVTVNEAIAMLEGAEGIFICNEVLLDTPPVSPAEGDLYIVGTSPTGAWASHPEQPVLMYNGNWLFYPVFDGMYADDRGTQTLYRYGGTSGWVVFSGGSGFTTASTTEVLTGTDTTKGVTPDALAALWEQGSNIASAGTISVGEGGYFNVTGVTGITDIDFAVDKTGRKVWLKFAGILTLTHSSTLILPSAANITTAAGDTACFISEGTDIVRCVSYNRADGTALISSGFTAASTTEVLTGTDTTKGVTPDALAALWEKGADVASAGTISLGEGGLFHITGTTTITDIDFATPKDGRSVSLIFDGILTLTHNATTLVLPSGANITTAAGDRAIITQDNSDNIICIAYIRADGTALVSSGFTAASTTEVLTGTDTTKGVTPDALAALWEKGANVASAGTISLGEGGLFHITGVTTITDIDFATPKDGREACLIFDGALTLTHNGTTLQLPGAANITTVAGDRAIIVQDNGDNIICVLYMRADGSITGNAAKSQIGQITAFIEAPSNKAFTLIQDSKFGFTINEMTTKCVSGTCTLTGKIGVTNFGGTANSVSSAEQTQTHSSANVVATGDDVSITVSSNSTCVDMAVTIKYTRTLA